VAVAVAVARCRGDDGDGDQAGEAADGSGQIATNIDGVSGAADATNEELARMAAELRTTVSWFSY
jgi:hypothetical protein